MRVIVVYSSLSGNTKRLAIHIATRLSEENAGVLYQEDISIKNFNQENNVVCCIDVDTITKEKIDGYDADYYVLCSWIDKGKPDGKSLEKASLFAKQKVYLIATLGAKEGSPHRDDCCKNMKKIYEDAYIAGIHLAQGSISKEVIQRFQSLPKDHPHSMTEEKLAFYKSIEGRPNQEDIEKAYTSMKNEVAKMKKGIDITS